MKFGNRKTMDYRKLIKYWKFRVRLCVSGAELCDLLRAVYSSKSGPVCCNSFILPPGGAEIASTGKHKYGKCKYKKTHFVMMENASTENTSTNYILGITHNNTTSIGN